MVDNFDALAKALAPNTGETSKTYTAVVSHTDEEGIVWVRLPGAEQDTPTASTSAEAKMGDTVTVEWRNNKLYIAGNYTNPSAGVERVAIVDETAHVAKETAGEAQAAADEAQTTADGAQTIATAALNAAQATEQYFWHDSNGAHVTQVPKDDFILSPNGSNALLTSTGLEIRDGAERVLASFGARGARVGTEGQQSFVISPDGAEVYDSEGATTFHVGANQVSVRKRMSTLNVPLPQVVGETVTFVLDPPADYDLGNLSFYVFVGANGGSTWTTNIDYYDAPAYAGPGGNQGSWEVVVTDTDPTTTVVVTCLRKDATQQADQDQCWIRYWGYGPAPTFEFGFENDVTGSGGFASGGNNTVTAAVAHAEGSFNTASGVAAHAEGAESTASALAAHAEGSHTEASAESAHAEGVGTEASGVGAHAEGNQSVASGAYSHAEGSNTEASATASHASGAGTIAQGIYQTVVGVYNTAEGDGSSSGGNHLLFIVGNGTDDNNRSNALAVDWAGDVVASGDITDGAGNTLSQMVNDVRMNGASVVASGVANVTDTAGNMTLNGALYFGNAKNIYFKDTGGTYRAVVAMSNSNNTVLGYGGYDASQGGTNIYGNTVRLYSRNAIQFDQPLAGLVKLTEYQFSTPAMNAHTYESTTSATLPAQTGYIPVGIVGWRVGNYHVNAFNLRLNGRTIYGGFSNPYNSNVAASTCTVNVLWLKATEA